MEAVNSFDRSHMEYAGALQRLQDIASEDYTGDSEEALNLLNAIAEYGNGIKESLDECRQQLQEARKEIDSFNYMVSHDLRTPLRSAEIFSNLVAEKCHEGLDEKGRKYVDNVQVSLKQMNRFINGMLEYSRVGRRALQMVPVSMKDVFSAGFQLLTKDDTRTIDFQISDLPPIIADEVMMKQLAQHLLSNAVKFSGKMEHPVIRVGFLEENGETVFYVNDNGTGFNMKYKGKLFRMFERLHGFDEFEGTGAGLAIAHRIITRHGGRIWADAVQGEGATFYFTLSQ